MKKKLVSVMVFLFACIGLFVQVSFSQNQSSPSLHSQQLMVVLTNGWDSLRGTLYAIEKHGNQWKLAFSNSVVLGAKGLGMGDGAAPIAIAGAPVKKEGDLKSPAGIFTIGAAFGYAPSARWIKDGYIQAADTVICVDDARSVYYNTLLKTDTVKSDWNSFEYMHRHDNYYKWGLFVNHNSGKPVAGKGSCIFMHIWENDNTGTEGCTAMQEADILRLLHWINAGKQPLLVQLPATEYENVAAFYNLPMVK